MSSTGRPRAVFFGSPAFAVPALRATAASTELVAVVSQPDRPAGRGQAETAPAVKVAARELGVEVLQPASVRTPETLQTLAALRADLFIVAAYGRILPQSVLDLPRLGPFNVHASLLPKLRGAAPIQWSIIRGDSETGVALMRMEAGLDTGPVAAVRRLPIADDDTTGSLSLKLAELGAALLGDTIPDIAAGRVDARAPRRCRGDARPHAQQGRRRDRLSSASPAGLRPGPGCRPVAGGHGDAGRNPIAAVWPARAVRAGPRSQPGRGGGPARRAARHRLRRSGGGLGGLRRASAPRAAAACRPGAVGRSPHRRRYSARRPMTGRDLCARRAGPRGAGGGLRQPRALGRARPRHGNVLRRSGARHRAGLRRSPPARTSRSRARAADAQRPRGAGPARAHCPAGGCVSDPVSRPGAAVCSGGRRRRDLQAGRGARGGRLRQRASAAVAAGG